MNIWRNTKRHDGIVRKFWRDSPEQFRHKSATIPPNTQKIGGVAVMAEMGEKSGEWGAFCAIYPGRKTLSKRKRTRENSPPPKRGTDISTAPGPRGRSPGLLNT